MSNVSNYYEAVMRQHANEAFRSANVLLMELTKQAASMPWEADRTDIMYRMECVCEAMDGLEKFLREYTSRPPSKRLDILAQELIELIDNYLEE